MKIWLGATFLLLLVLTAAVGQPDRSRIYSSPLPPPREVLDRLNLKLAWTTAIPMDGSKDGFTSIQLAGKNLLVQTRSGLVSQLNAETGQAQWRNRVGNAYQNIHQPAYNNTLVFVLNNNFLYGLDRVDGQIQYQMSLPGGISAPPVADDDQIYLPTVAGRLRAYRLPNLMAERAYAALRQEEDAKETAIRSEIKTVSPYETPKVLLPPPGARSRIGPQPVPVWSTAMNLHLDFRPLLTYDVITMASADGGLQSFTKYVPSQGLGQLPLFRFRAEGDVTVPLGQYDDVCYLGSTDTNVYAIHMLTGRVIWRHTAGSPIARQPLPTRNDVFVSSARNGLARLDRGTGESLWRVPRGKRLLAGQPDVDQVLAVNPKFVYATDRSGRLVVLDRNQGTILSTYDLRDFAFLTPNDLTDRLYLAAQNGLLICLHDREYVKPYFHRELPNSLEHKMLRQVTIPEFQNKTLRDVLKDLEIDLQIKIVISQPTFKLAGRPNPEELKLTAAVKIEGTLTDVLHKILERPIVDATFDRTEDTIVVIPKAKGADKPPEEKPPAKDM